MLRKLKVVLFVGWIRRLLP